MDLRGTLVRGGTSKCWLFTGSDVPASRAALAELLIAAYDAGDRRHIDGIGGATSTTSKAAIVTPSNTPHVDIDYLFAQIGIGERRVEWGSNCGNCATAIALYAVQKGLLAPGSEETRVRMRNVNTGARLDAVIATPGAQVAVQANALVPGAEAGGVAVRLVFLAPSGTTTGTLLPTGMPSEPITIGSRTVLATLVDAGAPVALLRAADFGLTGHEPPSELAEWLPIWSQLRQIAGQRMGLTHTDEPIQHAVPKVGIVGRVSDGQLPVRMLSMHEVHPAIGLTSAVAIAVAARVPGTVLGGPDDPGPQQTLSLATPAGVVVARSVLNGDGQTVDVELERAARIIADATIYLPLAA